MLDPFKKPVLGFAAYSGTGKTTLLKQLIPRLRKQGLRLALIKHSHHDFEIDHPGKDSYELRHAGARQTLITSAYRSAWIRENPEPSEPDLLQALQQLDLDDIDLVLVEGFRNDARLPRIELHRSALNKPFLHREEKNIIAIASDIRPDADLPCMDINRVDDIAAFVQDWLTQQTQLAGAET